MPIGPRLETERLLLRVGEACDFEAFAAFNTDEDAMRFTGGHMPRAAAWRKFLVMPGAWVIQGFGMFSVIEKSSGEWLGQLGPWQPDGWPGTEVGWGFKRSAWGRGYATEAARIDIWAQSRADWRAGCARRERDAHERASVRVRDCGTRAGVLAEPRA